MQKFIESKTPLININGKPSPCHCTNTITCAYCVQANLILWEEKSRSVIKSVQEPLIATIKEKGVRKASRLIGISPNTVTYWIKSRNIPNRYIDKVRELCK